MKVTVLGSGRWASNIVGLLLKNGHEVLVWEKVFENIPESDFFLTGKNKYIDLSNYFAIGKLKFTHGLTESLDFGEVVFISILSQKVRELFEDISRIDGYKSKKYCLAMKGIESGTGKTLSEILMQFGIKKVNICCIAGPGHVQSIAANKETHMVVASYVHSFAETIKQLMTTASFKLFVCSDVKGVEICAAAKNVYGALAGICVGSQNETLRGSLMCASLAEMEKYLEAMQCVPKTARRLALLGDYDATMYDSNSHNLNYGIEIMKQNTIEPELPFASIEGKYAVEGLMKRLADHNSQVSDIMELEAPLLDVYNKFVGGKIEISNIIFEIVKAIEKIYSKDL